MTKPRPQAPARQCLECQINLPEGSHPRRKYCSERCAERVKKRRHRQRQGHRTQTARLYAELAEARAMQEQHRAEAAQARAEADRERRKRMDADIQRNAVRKDNKRARETVGQKLKEVHYRLAAREAQQLEQFTGSAEFKKLSRVNAQLREEIAHRDEVVRRHVRQREEDQRINHELRTKLDQYIAVAQRMQIKGEAMFTVFTHWNQVMAWFFDHTQGIVETEEEAEWLRFWSYMHQHQSHIFRNGYMETSLDDEWGASNET
ncbi:hypothetical protein [Nesterenkonia cremea]|uniref:Uncharacterized protein n=1 Tax=Nesterenkonia cremea TaxID=1882340 RepID=A0A917AVV7_9MICC|nr:hypothetical protein [Nesterenkonia cremea]GGE78786.1 hypothetical protein GCM10011401_27610 [Nesterenkonia cremea]